MIKPLTIILTGYGINCDYETEHCFNISGSNVLRLHLNELAKNKSKLLDAQIFVIPGGFSFADDIASGKILANKLKYKLSDILLEFVNRDKLILGICNGFQVLIRLGLLPGHTPFKQEASLCINDSSIFENRWCYLKVKENSPCVFLKNIHGLYLPVRHMEGKLVLKDETILKKMQRDNTDCLIYTSPNGQKAFYPYNPNGSKADLAGICDKTGRIFGLMPHPEAYNHLTNSPHFNRPNDTVFSLGTQIMNNAVSYYQ